MGKTEHADDLRLDKNNTLKGKLHFVAEFVPALLLKNVRFDVPQNEIQKAVKVHQAESIDIERSSTASSHSTGGMPQDSVPQVAVTQDDGIEEKFKPGHTKGLESTNTARTVGTTLTTETVASSANGNISGMAKGAKFEGVEMSKEELLQHRK